MRSIQIDGCYDICIMPMSIVGSLQGLPTLELCDQFANVRKLLCPTWYCAVLYFVRNECVASRTLRPQGIIMVAD
jgi:hypothetical protein